MRIYTLLRQYSKLEGREIELEQLRNTLGLRSDQYKLYGHLRTCILEPVQKELKAKADLYFEFDEIKYGRRVGAIRFHIISKKFIKNELNDVLADAVPITHELLSSEAQISAPLTQLLLLIPGLHKSKKTVLSVLELYESKHGFDYVKRNILYSNANAAKSYAGYLNKALKEDWGHDWELEQKEVIVKKKSVEVWERQGFSSEKEYAEYSFNKQMNDINKKS